MSGEHENGEQLVDYEPEGEEDHDHEQVNQAGLGAAGPGDPNDTNDTPVDPPLPRTPSPPVRNLRGDLAAEKSASSGGLDLASTMRKMKLVVDRALDALQPGQELPASYMKMLDTLASASRTGVSVTSESSVAVVSPSTQQIMKRPVAVLTQADVKRLPRLSGNPEVGHSGDVDVS